MDLKKVLERLENIERMPLTSLSDGNWGAHPVGNEAVKTEIRQLQRDIEQFLIRTTGTV